MSKATTTARLIHATLDKLGASLPKPTARDYDKLQTLRAKADQLDLNANLEGAVLAALENNRDPLTDEAVHRETARLALRGIENSLTAALDDRTQRYLEDHGEALIEAMRPAFDAAAADLAQARDLLGDLPLDDTAGILKKGGNAAAVWAKAKEADATIRQISQAWGVLATALPIISHDPQYSTLRTVDVDPAAWHDQRMRGAKLGAWDALLAGHRLDLASPETVRERIAAVLKEMQAEQARPAEEFRKNFRRLRGTAGA